MRTPQILFERETKERESTDREIACYKRILEFKWEFDGPLKDK